MNYLIFGTGDYYERYKKWFAGKKILALLDNSVQKQYRCLDGIEILPPEEGVKLSYDAVIILSFYVKQMKQQLLSLGVDKDKIFHFYNLRHFFSENDFIRPVQYYAGAREITEPKSEAGIVKQEPAATKVLLLSPELTLGGPSIALFHAAIILKAQGYCVVYASMIDGVLRKTLIKHDIPVLIDENLQLAVMKERKWINAFSTVICNTINFHVFLSERDHTMPVVWWLHETEFFYDGAERSVLEKISPENLKLVSVGPVPKAAVKKFLPKMNCEELLYGAADVQTGEAQAKPRSVTRFITIGFLEDIKGQDVLIEAVRRLSADNRHQCEFYIVGHDQTLFGEQIHRESAGMDEIIFTGSVDREKIHELLGASDVLICPSRQDSMPTVAAEAMMHAVPCIVSDVTGTAEYIQDGEDGFVFPCGDVQALSDRILWCIEHKSKIGNIGKRARELYEKRFSMPAFEKHLLEIVHEILDK